MEKYLKQLEKAAKSVKLDNAEKSQIKDNLVLFMDQNPVRFPNEQRQIEHTRSNYFQNFWKLENVNWKLNYMPILIILALLVGGGTSLAAESSLPGDPLYAIKVNVNEEVVGRLRFSNEAKTNWESKLMAKRLQEAEELAAKGELDADVKAKIEARFKAHADKVADRIDRFESKENFDAAVGAASNFEVSLKAHERILNQIVAEAKSGNREGARLLAIKVAARAQEARNDRIKIEAKASGNVGTQSAAEGKMNATENKIDEVRKFIERNESRLGAEATVQAEARLKSAENLMIAGRAKLEAKVYGEAFVLFQKAHTTAQAAKLLIEARKDLDIKVRLNGNASTETNTSPSTKSEVRSNTDADVRAGNTSAGVKSRLEVDFGF